MSLSRKRIILSLGTNLGDREKNLSDALNTLTEFIEINKVSPIYKTASLLRDTQDEYYNICISGLTALTEEELIVFLKEKEALLGRKKTDRWQSRLIDIDIIDYCGRTYRSDKLSIPHKEMPSRSFVLYPLNDIDEKYIHPVSGKSIESMIKELEDDLDIQKIGDLKWR